MSSKKPRVIIVATHPIQYQVPWFRSLHASDAIELTVFYGMLPDSQQQSTGFAKEFSWDIPLLEGYHYQVLENQANQPTLAMFSGIDCPNISRSIASLQPDVLILTGWHSKLLLQAYWAALRTKTKIIMRGDSNAMRRRAWYKRLLHRLFLSQVEAFLPVGLSNRQFYLDNGVAAEQLFNAPHFIENARFIKTSQCDQAELVALRAELGLDSQRFCFVFSGKLIETKNIMELLGGLRIVYQTHKNVQLLIIGDGPQRQQLEAYCQQHKLPVIFAGFTNQSKIPKLYTLGDCFLLASIETWGLVVNEAMVCGLPAIVSDRAGCHPDLISEGETGWTYQYGEQQQLARKMSLSLNNPDKTAKMGQAAKSRVLQHFDVEVSSASTLKAIQALVTSE